MFYHFKSNGDSMSCLEVLGLLSFTAYIVVEVFKIAFKLGKNAKK